MNAVRYLPGLGYFAENPDGTLSPTPGPRNAGQAKRFKRAVRLWSKEERIAKLFNYAGANSVNLCTIKVEKVADAASWTPFAETISAEEYLLIKKLALVQGDVVAKYEASKVSGKLIVNGQTVISYGGMAAVGIDCEVRQCIEGQADVSFVFANASGADAFAHFIIEAWKVRRSDIDL